MSDISELISTASLVINIVALAFVALGIILGIKRGLLHSTFRLVAVLLAAGVSIVVARMLRPIASEMISNLIFQGQIDPSIPLELQLDPAIQNLLNASPTATELVINLPAALAAPLVFFVSFMTLNTIFYLLYKIPKRLTKNLKKKCAETPVGKTPIGRLLGAGVSLAASFLIVACFLAPFAGYVSFADEIVTELEGVSIDEETDQLILEIDETYLTPVKNNQALTIAGTLMNPIVFDSVTNSEIAGYKVVWREEIAYLADTYGTLKPLLDTGFDLSTFGETEATALRTFAANFDNSVLIPHIIAELLPAMATEWNQGNDFMGMENPANTVPAQLQPMMGTVVNVLESTTYESLPKDITTLTELIATLSESGTLAMLGDDISARDIIAALSKPGLISGLIDNLYLNEHMRTLVTDMANLGFDAISESLHIPADDDAVRDELSHKIHDAVVKTESIEGYDEKINSLSGDLNSLFSKYGVSSDKETAKLYAECIVGVGPITTEGDNSDVVDYFTVIGEALNEELANASLMVSPVYGNTPTSDKVKEAVRAYLATADSAAAKNAAKIANQMRGEEKLQHSVITMQDIHLSATEMGMMSFEDIHKQSQSLEDIVSVLATVITFDEAGDLSIDIAKIDTDALSGALFRLASTGTDAEGHEVHNIAHAITGVVKYSLYQVGIDAAAANDLVNHMTTDRPEGNGKNPLSSAMAVITVIQPNEEMTKEEVKESITTLVKDLDKDSAKVLSDCISLNLINNFTPVTLPEEEADALVTVTKDIINNFGEHADELTEEQLEAESVYVETIFDLAINAKTEDTNSFFASEESESSSIDMTAEEFVDTISHSVIISNTVKSETENLKAVVGETLPEADKEILIDALEKNETIDEELKNALLNIFGITGTTNLPTDLPTDLPVDLGGIGQ